MKEYHKIPTIWKRDPETTNRCLLSGFWATPELDYLKDNQWIWTEKVDGTNIRVMYECDGEGGPATIRYGGRTDSAQIPAQLITALDIVFRPNIGIMDQLFDGPVCLYGEGYGAKIQKGGGNYRKDQGFVLFDIQIGEWWLKRENVENIAHALGLNVVPVVGQGTLSQMVDVVLRGFESTWGPFPAEGVVARPKMELKDRAGHRIICKLKHKDFK